MIYSLCVYLLFARPVHADLRTVFLKPDTQLLVRDLGDGQIQFTLCERGQCEPVGQGPYRIGDLQELAHADAVALSRVSPIFWELTNNKDSMFYLGVLFAPFYAMTLASLSHHDMPGFAILSGGLEIWAFTPSALSALVEKYRRQVLRDKDVMYSVLNRSALVRGQVAKSFVKDLRSALGRIERGRYRGCAPELRFQNLARASSELNRLIPN